MPKGGVSVTASHPRTARALLKTQGKRCVGKRDSVPGFLYASARRAANDKLDSRLEKHAG